MREVIVYFAPGNARSQLVGQAMLRGIRNFDPTVQLISSQRYRGPNSRIAVFYGLSDGLRQVFDDYRQDERRKAIYVDLGYWGRRKKTRFDGYHKISIDSRHPTGYFQTVEHPADRFRSHSIQIKPWREDGRHILVIGMSGKGALAEGFVPEQWERRTVMQLRELTKRPIVYRPKPNWIGAKPIMGAAFQRESPIEHALADAWAVVCHHSNVAVEAILAGVPAICPLGVASVMAGHRLEQIDAPPMPEGREQWASDIAYCQWTMAEMQSGAAWRHLRKEGLV